MKVFILAGGSGTRLYPYSLVIPKCAIPIKGRPFIHKVIEFYKGHDITILTEREYEEYYRAITNVDVYGFEEEYNTAGKILKYSFNHKMPDKFIIHYCDSYAEYNLNKLDDLLDKYIAVMVLYGKLPVEYGIVDIEDDRVVKIFEKPKLPYYTWTGILGCRRRILDYIVTYNDDWARDVIPILIEEEEVVYIEGRNFIEVGSLPSIRRALEVLGGGR